MDAERAVSDALSHDNTLFADPASTLVVASGKGAAAMARACAGARSGYVLVPHGTPTDAVPPHFKVAHGGHPVPDSAGLAASREILDAVEGLTEAQTLLYLVSGGTSALFEVPVASVPAAHLIEAYRELLLSGAAIEEVNVVRRALSIVKGGGLARAAHPARVVTLAVSDVEGDDPVTIGSGPTVKVRAEEAAAEIVERYGLRSVMPDSVLARLYQSNEQAGHSVRAGQTHEDIYRIVASSESAVNAASDCLRQHGYEVLTPAPMRMRGDTGKEARRLAGLMRTRAGQNRRAMVVGGETTVKVHSEAGVGGRCQHLAAALVPLLAHMPPTVCVIAGTDGRDGNSDAAGAIVSESTAARAEDLGLDPLESLAHFDSATLFRLLGDQVITGPTETNVADLFVAATSAGRETS